MIRRNGFTMTAIGGKQRVKDFRGGRLKFERLERLNCFCAAVSEKRVQNHIHDAQHDGAEEGGPKAGNIKARHKNEANCSMRALMTNQK